jgi:hypothetical protein
VTSAQAWQFAQSLGRGDVEEPAERGRCAAQHVLRVHLDPGGLGRELLALLVTRLIGAGDTRQQSGLLHIVVRLGEVGEGLGLDALLHGDDLVELVPTELPPRRLIVVRRPGIEPRQPEGAGFTNQLVSQRSTRQRNVPSR